MNAALRPSYFNIDELAAEAKDAEDLAATIDICVAALAFRNFEFAKQRLPFVVECVTRSASTWQKLVEGASELYWLRESGEAIALYLPTDHCGCSRTYRSKANGRAPAPAGKTWINLPNEAAFYAALDTPSARAIYGLWYSWSEKRTQEANELAQGRNGATWVEKSLILSSTSGCLACSAPVVGFARTTIGMGTSGATLIQLPVCAAHLEAAKASPSVMAFLAATFSLSIDLPDMARTSAIPDALIPTIHTMAATELGGRAMPVEPKGDRGWKLRIQLPSGWHWLFRVNTLEDYAYMLFDPSEKKAVYRADSATDHPDLKFAPDHEHSKPDRKNDVARPSFLYGVPTFDLKRMRQVGEEKGAYGS